MISSGTKEAAFNVSNDTVTYFLADILNQLIEHNILLLEVQKYLGKWHICRCSDHLQSIDNRLFYGHGDGHQHNDISYCLFFQMWLLR